MALITPSRATGQLFGPVGRSIKFGFITDLHHDPIKATDTSQGGKVYQDAAEKAADIAAIFAATPGLSFAYQNGDFIDGSASEAAALADLATITSIYAPVGIPVYHCIGNHEVTRLTKAQVRGVTGQSAKYYYFDVSGVRFIVLDGTYTADDDDADLEISSIGGASPYISYVPPTQRQWLDATIDSSPYPCVVFCHYPLYYVGAFGWGLTNAVAVREILEAHYNKVIGCICGHLHENYTVIENGIAYITTHAATTAAYPKLNYSIVTVYPDSRQIKLVSAGFSASHINSDNQEIFGGGGPDALSNASPDADAWCWFHEPRAVASATKTWFGTAGSDNNSVLTGRAMVYEVDNDTGDVISSVMTTSTTAANWADDHDYPSIIQRPDGRLIAFYSPHRTGGPIYFKISIAVGSIAQGWSQEYSLGNGANYPTYPSPVMLTGEANKLYLFYRNGLSSGPLSYVTSGDIATVTAATVVGGPLGSTPTWAAELQLATSAGTQGIYHKVTSNGVDRIDLAMTDAVASQAGTKNDVRHAYWQGGLWHASDGTSLGDGSTPPGFAAFTAIATSAAPDSFGDMWVHHIQRRSDGVIEVVFYRFISTSDHRCYYARWNGSAWSKSEIDAGEGMGNPDTRSTQITDGQGAGEGYYSPGAFFDPNEEGVLYISVGTASYSQLYRYTTTDYGATWTRRRISGLAGENVRPVVPSNRHVNRAVLWMNGDYHHYDFNTNPVASDIGYTTRIKSASRDYAVVGVTPINAVAPSVAGSTGTQDNVLTAALGTWHGDMPMTFSYQWVNTGVDIVGATSSTYTILAGDVGDSITVKVTATNHYGATVAESAPASALPTNLVPNSEAFNLWTASGSTVIADVIGTADRMTETATNTQHILTSSNMNITSGVTYTFSLKVTYDNAQFIQLLFGSAAFGSNAWGNFDMQNGTVTATKGSAATTSVIDEGDGYRLVCTATATGTAAAPVAIFGANVGTMTRAASYLGSTSNRRTLINAQVETGATANTYVPT